MPKLISTNSMKLTTMMTLCFCISVIVVIKLNSNVPCNVGPIISKLTLPNR